MLLASCLVRAGVKIGVIIFLQQFKNFDKQHNAENCRTGSQDEWMSSQDMWESSQEEWEGPQEEWESSQSLTVCPLERRVGSKVLAG